MKHVIFLFFMFCCSIQGVSAELKDNGWEIDTTTSVLTINSQTPLRNYKFEDYSYYDRKY